MDDEPQNPEAIIEPLREQSARNEEMGFPHPVVHLAAAEAAVREGFAAGRAAERAATELLREALAFYANADNYVGGEVGWWGKTVSGDPLWCMDFGVIARNALAGEPTHLPSERGDGHG